MQLLWNRLTIGALAAGLVVVATAAIVVSATTDWLQDWTPNIAIEALSLLLTIAVVDRVVARREREDARTRMHQALRRVSDGLHALADFALWDYTKMHQRTYERPPNELRALLDHFRAGLATRDTPWLESPAMLTATRTISDYLDQQIQRHERVLDNDFVAASYRYIQLELVDRNMYLDDRDHPDEDGWKSTALESLTIALNDFLDVAEPYVRQYLEPDWTVRKSDDEIDYARRIYGPKPAAR